jgi:hypothetical protein
MLAVIFFGFVFSFYLTFGQELQGFSSITNSAASVISGISGNIDTDELMAVAGVPGIVSYLCFLLFFILVLLTMFLAVINQGRRAFACSIWLLPCSLLALDNCVFFVHTTILVLAGFERASDEQKEKLKKLRERQEAATQDGKLLRWCAKPAEALLGGGGPLAEPAGVLNVVVWGCRGLMKADIGGKSDPFVKLSLLQAKRKTKVVPDSLDPNFNKAFSFDIPAVQLAMLTSNAKHVGVEPAVLSLTVMDHVSSLLCEVLLVGVGFRFRASGVGLVTKNSDLISLLAVRT